MLATLDLLDRDVQSRTATWDVVVGSQDRWQESKNHGGHLGEMRGEPGFHLLL